MKLYDRWLAADDGRTLQEFVASLRETAHIYRQQSKLAYQLQVHIGAQQVSLQQYLVNAYSNGLQQTRPIYVPAGYHGGLIAGLLGGWLR